MEKNYVTPSMQLVLLSTTDVITASDAIGDWMWNDGELPEEDFE